jgi:two-component system, LuxR family, response regulator FixJ
MDAGQTRSAGATVFLVDDDQSVRQALQWLIESIELKVAAFASADQFLEAFDPDSPGCLVVDVRMPGMSGLELQQQLTRRQCRLPVIVITGHGDVPMCVRAFEAGAFAFLEKPVNEQQLLDHIQKAIEEDRQMRARGRANVELAPRLELLTEREREVMDLMLAGRSLKQIASQLGISVPTCSKHRARVLEKTEVVNDVELVRLMLTGKRTP